MTSSPPSIRPLGLQPLTVEGLNFSGGETVTVLVTGPPRAAARHAVASAQGSFRIVFDDLDATGSGLRVRATGSDGHAAIWAPRALRISLPST
jgi:hypothetical protein